MVLDTNFEDVQNEMRFEPGERLQCHLSPQCLCLSWEARGINAFASPAFEFARVPPERKKKLGRNQPCSPQGRALRRVPSFQV